MGSGNLSELIYNIIQKKSWDYIIEFGWILLLDLGL